MPTSDNRRVVQALVKACASLTTEPVLLQHSHQFMSTSDNRTVCGSDVHMHVCQCLTTEHFFVFRRSHSHMSTSDVHMHVCQCLATEPLSSVHTHICQRLTTKPCVVQTFTCTYANVWQPTCFQTVTLTYASVLQPTCVAQTFTACMQMANNQAVVVRLGMVQPGTCAWL